MHRVVTLTAALVFTVCCGKEARMDLSETAALRNDPDALGRRLGLALPPDTQIIHVEVETGLDDAIFAKLRVPAGRADAFVKSLHITNLQRNAADLLGPDRGPWGPHHADGLRVGDVPLASTRGLVVGLDDKAIDGLVVYVMNHGT